MKPKETDPEPYDPTAKLYALLKVGARIRRVVSQEGMPSPEDADALAAGLEELHEYIAAGGDLPGQWDPCFLCGDSDVQPNRRCNRHGKLVPMRRPTYLPGL